MWSSLSPASRRNRKESTSLEYVAPSRQTKQVQTKQKFLSQGALLGEGNSATVTLAQSQPDGKLIAVKEFRAVSKDRSCPNKIRAEYYIANGFKHENIVQTLDLQFIGRKWCMLMEYVPNNLLDTMSSTSLAHEEIDSYFAQLVNGVAYIHKRGFAHRDLKLENLLLTKDKQLKIADFGTVATHKSTPVDHVGSQAYMAPELFSERNNTYLPQPADVWSVAIVYCCMILRRFPWAAAKPTDSRFRAFVQHNREVVAERDWDRGSQETLVEEGEGKESFLPQLPLHTRDIICRMLQVDPQRRPVIGRVRAYCDSARLSTLWEEM